MDEQANMVVTQLDLNKQVDSTTADFVCNSEVKEAVSVVTL